MKKKKSRIFSIIFLILAFIIGSCSEPSTPTPEPKDIPTPTPTPIPTPTPFVAVTGISGVPK
ncbi:MAG: hypothetical protein LBV17_11225 [Treponema sp.]|nr:hypothetical protein [Treponema sp.]